MARPRNTLFYETPLPDFLPPEKEWLRDYHKNSRKVLEYIVRNGAKSTAYHGAIKALTLFREHLLQTGAVSRLLMLHAGVLKTHLLPKVMK